ncbi:MAG: hypothetical protein HY782_10795 [Chloroflexi bacterium]|nr:hypothetical protein [Chloroflexota bacterium]
MRVTIDRNLCGSWAPACEECFGVFLARNYAPDRACITEVLDDGSDILSAVIHSGRFVGTLIVRPENREAVIREGWRKFSTLPDEAFDICQPHGDDLRKAARRN